MKGKRLQSDAGGAPLGGQVGRSASLVSFYFYIEKKKTLNCDDSFHSLLGPLRETGIGQILNDLLGGSLNVSPILLNGSMFLQAMLTMLGPLQHLQAEANREVKADSWVCTSS